MLSIVLHIGTMLQSERNQQCVCQISECRHSTSTVYTNWIVHSLLQHVSLHRVAEEGIADRTAS